MRNVIILDKENIHFLRGEKKQSLYSISALHTLKCKDAPMYKRDGSEILLYEDCVSTAVKLFQNKLGIHIKDLQLLLPPSITWFNFLVVEDMPKTQKEADEFVLWKIQKLLPIPQEQVIIRYHLLAKDKGGTKLLIAATFDSFIKAIESCFRKLGILTTYISPPTISFLNVFENSLPKEGVVCWLRETSYSMVCFHEGMPVVIREVDREINLNRIEGELFSFTQSVRETYPAYKEDTILYFDELQRTELNESFSKFANELNYKKLIQKTDSNIRDLPMYISALGLLE